MILKAYLHIPLMFWLIITLCIAPLKAQEDALQLFKSDYKLAVEHFKAGNYASAIELFELIEKSDNNPEINRYLALSHYHLNQWTEAIRFFENIYSQNRAELDNQFLTVYAQALQGTGDYEKAQKIYEEIINSDPNEELVIRKIWRLSNIKYLFQDSIHFSIKEVQKINSQYSEFGAVSYNSGLLFVSNRPQNNIIKRLDAANYQPFYQIFFLNDTSQLSKDASISINRFAKKLNSDAHIGPLSVYDQGKKIAFIRSVKGKNKSTLQLFFAGLKDDEWVIKDAFPYNSDQHSIYDVNVDEAGANIYFSSDMEGGKGGKDIYHSSLENGTWMKPENLTYINTNLDESHPFLLGDNVLYFASVGHPGLGGLDIFKIDLNLNREISIENLGYPINSRFDDFSISLDSLGTKGYISSNRKKGGFDDDIYKIQMDLQVYPIVVRGVIRQKESNLSDDSEIINLGSVKIELIDIKTNKSVASGVTDRLGSFTLQVPYFSEYKLKVTEKDLGEVTVSFQVPKYRKFKSDYEVVVVRDEFKAEEDK